MLLGPRKHSINGVSDYAECKIYSLFYLFLRNLLSFFMFYHLNNLLFFTKRHQGFGTILFDSVYFSEKIENSLEKILAHSDKDFKDQIKLLQILEKAIEGIEEVAFGELVETLRKCETKAKGLKNEEINKIKNMMNRNRVQRKPIKKIRQLNFKNKMKLNQEGNSDDEITLGENKEIEYFREELGDLVLDNINLKLEEEEIELGGL